MTMADLDKTIEEIENCIGGNPYCAICKHHEHMACKSFLLANALELLKDQQPKWIPVSERLPKKEDIPYDCLVTLEHGVVCEATFLDMDAPYHKWCANTGWLYHVTHWMPMPKPPKDGEQFGKI